MRDEPGPMKHGEGIPYPRCPDHDNCYIGGDPDGPITDPYLKNVYADMTAFLLLEKAGFEDDRKDEG
jgi:hypothetical protein